jgi:predicted nucleotidyltransferase
MSGSHISDYGLVPNLGTIVPTVGTTDHSSLFGSALFSRTRGSLLALLFGHPDKRFYTRQIIEALGDASGAARRELKGLTGAGILLREREGRQVYYRANPACPIFPELVGLVRKTVGLVDVMRTALEPLGERVAVAFVYGSMAKGSGNTASDVDLMVIGAAGFGEVVDALAPAQDALGREVNPSVYGEAEVGRRLSDGEHFLTSVMREQKLFVIGGPDDLGRVAGAGLADASSDQSA